MKLKKLTLTTICFALIGILAGVFMVKDGTNRRLANVNEEIGRYSVVERRITDSTCPKCNGKMENGFVVDKSSGAREITSWVQGTPKADDKGVNTEPSSPIVTMRCKACGFLESYAK